jgi:hypothetical protein
MASDAVHAIRAVAEVCQTYANCAVCQASQERHCADIEMTRQTEWLFQDAKMASVPCASKPVAG